MNFFFFPVVILKNTKASKHICLNVSRDVKRDVRNPELYRSVSYDTGQSGDDVAPHLLLILPSGGVQGLDQSCCVANKNGIASSSDDHAQHGEPDIGEALRGLSTVTDAQHVAHRFEYGEGVQLGPGVVLQGDRKKTVKDGRCEGER